MRACVSYRNDANHVTCFIKNSTAVDEIDTVLLQVDLSLGFIPLVLHNRSDDCSYNDSKGNRR